MVIPGLVDENAFTKMKLFAVATLFCVVNVELVVAKLSEPAKLAVMPKPEPEDDRPKL